METALKDVVGQNLTSCLYMVLLDAIQDLLLGECPIQGLSIADSYTRIVAGGQQPRQRCTAGGSAHHETQADDLGPTKERHHTQSASPPPVDMHASGPSSVAANSSTRVVAGAQQSRHRHSAGGFVGAEDATDVGVVPVKGQPLLCLGPDG